MIIYNLESGNNDRDELNISVNTHCINKDRTTHTTF